MNQSLQIVSCTLSFNGHDMCCSGAQGSGAFSETLVGEVQAFSEPGATSVVNAEPDPDATQPLLDGIEIDDPASGPPTQVRGSCLSALVGDTPYVGLQRKKRRN